MTPKIERPKVKQTEVCVLNAKEVAGITIGRCGNCGYGVHFTRGETTTKCTNCFITVKLK